jgi:predicted Holliday junction resolvase-like endonuclease
MDNTANIFEQAYKYLTPIVSFIVVLVGYIWSRQITDFREWLTKHNHDIKELQEEREHDRRYVNEEMKEINQQMFGREITYNDRLNETREDVRGIKSDIENMKVICNVRHNR